MIVSLEAIFLSTFVVISQNRADERRQPARPDQTGLVDEVVSGVAVRCCSLPQAQGLISATAGTAVSCAELSQRASHRSYCQRVSKRSSRGAHPRIGLHRRRHWIPDWMPEVEASMAEFVSRLTAQGGRARLGLSQVSERTCRRGDKRIVDEAHDEAARLLTENRDRLAMR